MFDTGDCVTANLLSPINSPIFYRLCHGDKVMVLYNEPHINLITAHLCDVVSVEQFVERMADLKFGAYEK